MNLATLERACATTQPVVARVTPDQYRLGTPCTDWDVHDLLNHLVGTLALGRALLGDVAPEVAMGPGQLPTDDLVGDDPGGAYRRGVAALLAAVDDGAFARTHTTPLGEMPGAALAGFTVLDIVVHGWDLGRATGRPVAVDAALAEELLGFARQAFASQPRGGLLRPEVAVPAGAGPTERLVAFTGRTP
jgi:uncharacterized protein (TIGR03086 family)